MRQITDNSPRSLRHQIEHKKLFNAARHVATVCHQVDSCEADERLVDLSARCGFSAYDLVGLRLWAQGYGFTLVLVPLRLWYKPLWFHRAIELRDLIRRKGQRCIIAPASTVAKQPRLRNARLVAACTGYSVKITDQVLILDRVVEMGGISLQDAASMLEAHDPAGAVLSMVAKRQLFIDATKPIGPHTVLTVLA